MEADSEFVGTATGITGIRSISGETAGQLYSIEQYMRKDNTFDIEKEALEVLLGAYIEKNPNYKKALIIEKHPNRAVLYVTDHEGKVNFGEYTKTEFVEKAEKGEFVYGAVKLSEVAENTRKYAQEKSNKISVLEEKTEMAWKITPRRAIAVGVVSLVALIASCRIISSFGDKSPDFAQINYEKIEQKITGTEINLNNYNAMKKLDEKSAEYIIKETEWFLDEVDEGKITEQQKLKIQKLKAKFKEVQNAN